MKRAAIAKLLERLAESSVWRREACRGYRALLVGLIAWGIAHSLSAAWAFTIDDAGISYAYAKHLAQGYGPVAAPGGPWVEGYSNPLWVFLLVPLHWLGLPLPVVAKGLGATLLGASLWFGKGLLGALRLDAPRARHWQPVGALDVLMALGLGLCLELVVWVVAGLENPLFAALLLWMALLDVRESRDPTRVGWSGLAAFALSITRPEGAMYAAPLIAIKLGQAWHARAFVALAVRAISLFLGPLLTYHALHYAVFHELVPNTFYAKPVSRELGKGLEYLVTSLRASGLMYALPLAVLGLFGRLRQKLLLAWAALSGGVFVLYSGGDWMPHARFLSLFMPAVGVLSVLGVATFGRGLVWLSRGRLRNELVLSAVSGGLLWFWWQYHEPRLRELGTRTWCHFCERVADTERLKSLAKAAELPAYSLVTHDFGGPAWLSDEQFYPIDFLGLCDQSVALIRRDRSRLRGSIGAEPRLYQYLIHEQPSPPSWLLVPPNFWPRFDRSPEFLTGYFKLDPRLLPRARRDSFFGLHRSELVDYFPPLQNFEFRSLTASLALLGTWTYERAPRQGLGAGRTLTTLVSLLPRGKLRGTERLKVRIEGASGRGESAIATLGRGLAGLAAQLQPGEPLSVELSTTLPSLGAETYRLSLGVSSQKPARPGQPKEARQEEWSWFSLGEIDGAAALPKYARALPRYPSALPAPLHPELRRLRQPVALAIEAQRKGEAGATGDEPLAAELTALGRALDARGSASQAYLAYVWATQVDRQAWRDLGREVFRLRPALAGDVYSTELVLLRDYYAHGTLEQLARLVSFYLSEKRSLEAQYFSRHSPGPPAGEDTEPWAALMLAVQSQLQAGEELLELDTADLLGRAARDPLGGALDFESASLDAWAGDDKSFVAGPDAKRKELFALRGEHGQGLLSSLRGGNGARGRILSGEFSLDGRVLSLLVGGGSSKQKVGVELLVDGQSARSAHGNDSDFMFPVLWDVAKYQGKVARLRVFDDSVKAHVLVDRVLIWR